MSNDRHIILICTKCRGIDHATMVRKRLDHALPAGFDFRAVECMAGCDRPSIVGFQGKNKASYLFGDIEDVEDIDALIAFAQYYQNSIDGWTCADERPIALYHKIIARLPALGRSA